MLTDLLRFDPAEDLRAIFDQFEQRLSNWSRVSGERSLPAIATSEDGARVRIPLPGMAREDVEITASGRTLRVRASREDADGRTVDYDQTLTLPEHIDREKVTATMRNGLLEISMPFSEALKPRKIEIETDTPRQISAAA
jgi:HSP20 family protein